MAGTDNRHVFLHVFKYERVKDCITLDETEVYSSSSHAVITAVVPHQLNDRDGYFMLDAFEGAVLWVAAQGGDPVKILGATECLDLKSMVSMAVGSGDQDHLVITLRDSNSDHLTSSDTWLFLHDKNGDGLIDSIEKRQGL